MRINGQREIKNGNSPEEKRGKGKIASFSAREKQAGEATAGGRAVVGGRWLLAGQASMGARQVPGRGDRKAGGKGKRAEGSGGFGALWGAAWAQQWSGSGLWLVVCFPASPPLLLSKHEAIGS